MTSRLTRRLPSESLPLLVGDLLVILVFLAAGSLRHGENPVRTPFYFLGTSAPFVLGWLVASFLVGTYTERRRLSRAVGYVVVTWLIAASVGFVLRSTSYFHGNSPLSFVAVVTAVGLVSLVLWRSAVGYVVSKVEIPFSTESE